MASRIRGHMVWLCLALAVSAAVLLQSVTATKGQQPAPTVPPSLACLNPQPTSPAQPPVVCRGGGTILYPSGWNLVAGYDGRGAGTYITGASTPLYTLQAGDTSYEAVPSESADGITWTSLQTGVGYWVYFSIPTNVRFPVPPPVEPVTLTLPPGQWVLIGNPYAERSTVLGADVAYVYNTGTGVYQQTTQLAPGQGAFAYSVNGGALTFSTP